MTAATHEVWLQVTAGRGPAECGWAVIKTVEAIEAEAKAQSLVLKTLEIVPGSEPCTAQSVLIAITGDTRVSTFVDSWSGTVQWIAQSPFRPSHKRKNWFVGIDVLKPVDETQIKPGELRWDTMRASGPGGQHVNRTESAVRVTHIPTGIQAAAMEERSQHRNRKLALSRLMQKVEALNAGRLHEARDERWRAHQELERGNPIRIFRSG